MPPPLSLLLAKSKVASHREDRACVQLDGPGGLEDLHPFLQPSLLEALGSIRTSLPEGLPEGLLEDLLEGAHRSPPHSPLNDFSQRDPRSRRNL